MKKIVTTSYSIQLHKPVPEPVKIRIAFLSDLHNACGKEETQEVLRLLEEASPDLVLCGGDMIIAQPGVPTAPAVRFMKRLARRYTVWCGTGNHEYRARIYRKQYGTMYRDYVRPLTKAGVVFLENESAAVRYGGINVRLCGFDMKRRYYHRFNRERMPLSELTDVFGRPDPGEVTILLAHNPAQIFTYLKWGADLTLCGHYHGGLVHLPGGRALISPDFRLFPRNAQGLLHYGRRYAVISSGLGEHTVPVRVNNPREIVLIDLEIG
ncbi:MAG: metallophosphoesterase [Eubacterium sp.]|nr:metallophosphoesterase [Eubacterium sp.]